MTTTSDIPSKPASVSAANGELPAEIRRCLSGVQTLQELPAALSAPLAERLGIDVAAHFLVDVNGVLSETFEAWNCPAEGFAEELRTTLRQAAGAALTSGTVWHVRLEGSAPLSLIATSISPGGHPFWIFCGIVAADRLNREWLLGLEVFTALLESWLATYVAGTAFAMQDATEKLAHPETPSPRLDVIPESEAEQLAALVELTAKAESCPDLESACRMLARELTRSAEMHATGLVLRKPRMKLTAVAGEVPWLRQPADQAEIEALCEETEMRGTISAWPPANHADRHGLLLHRRFQEGHRLGQILSIPWFDDRRQLQAVLVVASNTPITMRSRSLHWLLASALRLGSTISLIRRTERPGWWLAGARVLRLVRKRLFWMAAAGIVGGLLLPYPHDVVCTCELQPVVRRYVTAPFAGSLEKSLVEPGDVVQEGDLLARIDGRENRMELASAAAEQSRASLQRDGYLAKHDVGQAAVGNHEIERLDAKRRLLEQRETELEIRSPIPGIVVAGDLKKVEGMPLKSGQTLFEIAPLDRMVFELHIPGDDVATVEQNQSVTVSLEAYADRKWTGPLTRLHPRSERIEEAYVFVGELEHTNEDGQLRPGMRGTARIRTGWKTLGWVWLHKAIDRFCLWMGW